MSKNSLYVDKIILAPMVRIGTLPMRLLALDHGADLVYTEEIIDWKLLRSKRRENGVLGTVDYIDLTDGTVVFRTCSREKSKVILQIGTSDPDRALKVAQLVLGVLQAIGVIFFCPWLGFLIHPESFLYAILFVPSGGRFLAIIFVFFLLIYLNGFDRITVKVHMAKHFLPPELSLIQGPFHGLHI